MTTNMTTFAGDVMLDLRSKLVTSFSDFGYFRSVEKSDESELEYCSAAAASERKLVETSPLLFGLWSDSAAITD